MRRTSSVRILFLLTSVFACAAVADDEPVIPAEKFVYCTVCHGAQMGGNPVLGAPRVSAMDAWYVEQQLQAFKKGWRGTDDADTGGQEMRPMAAALTDREIAQVAEYVQAVTSAAPAVTIDGDAAKGKVLYQSCAACHGATGQGNESLSSPALTGLNDWYLLTQLKNYKDGVRGSHPDDRLGQQMRSLSSLLVDEQAMKDVVHYISTLQSQE